MGPLHDVAKYDDEHYLKADVSNPSAGHGIWGERAAELAGEAITEAVQETLNDIKLELG